MAVNIGSMYASLQLDTRGYAAGWTRAAGITAAQSGAMRRHVAASQSAVARHFSETAAAIAVLHGPLGGIASRFGAFGSLLGRTNAALAVTAVSFSALGFGSYAFVRVADRAKLMSNQLRTVTSGVANLADIQQKLFDVSQRTRSSLEASTAIYARTSRATESLGVSQEKLLRITETVQKAFAVGGATTTEAQGAAIQLSQGIASDRFSGDEFRSVAENAPVLLRGIAESLGVTIGKLREMAHSGQLTADVVTKGILDSSERIDEAFAKTEATVGQATARLSNALLMYVGDANETFGITRTLAGGISALADNFKGLADAALLAGAAVLSAAGGRVLSGAARGIGGIFSGGITRGARARRDALIAQRSGIADEITQARKRFAEPSANLEAVRQDRINQAMNVRRGIEKQIRDLAARRAALETQSSQAISGQASAIRNVASASKEVQTISGRIAKNQTFIANARVRQAQIQKELNGFRAVGARGIEREKRLVSESNKLAADTVRAQKAIQSGQMNLSSAMARDLASVDRQLRDAQQNLRTSTSAVLRARNLFGKSSPEFGAAQDARRAEAANVAALRTQYAALTTQITALGRVSTFTGAAMAGIARAGSSLLGFLGGPWGVIFMGAIGALLYWQSQSAKAAKATEDFKQELRDLGYLASDTGKRIDDAANDNVAAIQKKIADARRELTNWRTELAKASLASTQITGSGFGLIGGFNVSVDSDVTRQVEDLRKRFLDNKISAQEFSSELDKVAKNNPGLQDIVTTLQALAREIGAASGLTATLEANLRSLGDPMVEFAKALESMQAASGAQGAERAGKIAEFEKEFNAEIDILGKVGDAYDYAKIRKKIFDDLQKAGIADADFLADKYAKQQFSVEKLADANKKAAENAKKFSEGMERLRLEALAAPLDDFGRSVVSTAQSLGIASSEIEQFIRAALSGGLDEVPEKFRKIADAIRETRTAGLERDIAFDRSQVGRTDWDQDIASKLREVFGDDYINHMDGAVAAQMRLNQQLQFTHDIGKSAFEGLIEDLGSGVKAADAFRNAGIKMLSDIGKKLAELAYSKLWQSALGPLFGSAFGGIGSLFGGGQATGGMGLNLAGPSGLYAKGGAFSGGQPVSSFAMGSAFANSIVSRPTMFSFARGGALGEMGEAGPEAVMPLTRTSGGKLGVMAKGVGGGVRINEKVDINVNVEGANGDQHVISLVNQGVSTGLAQYEKRRGKRYENGGKFG